MKMAMGYKWNCAMPECVKSQVASEPTFTCGQLSQVVDWNMRSTVTWDQLSCVVICHMGSTVMCVMLQGILDILLVTVSSSKPPVPSISAFRNDLSTDAYFVKVTIGSGRECPPDRKVNHLK